MQWYSRTATSATVFAEILDNPNGFDIVNFEPYVDWFNVMTYDIL
jgi:GH18 family chitinase